MGRRITLRTFSELDVRAKFVIVEAGIPKVMTTARVWQKVSTDCGEIYKGKQTAPSEFSETTIVIEVR
ncbi:hypothetical protein HQ571_01525 [Candidatus Kuenenbacteria bacterium]|nr:hypothetical protein [Candidatus Kuenenbacteria bacterium]